MTRGTLKTREYYLACRQDQGVVDSLIETARYKGVPVTDVMRTLGIDATPEMEKRFAERGVKLV